MLKLNRMLDPEPKPQPAATEGYRLDAYNMFMNCDPLPVQGAQRVAALGHDVGVQGLHGSRLGRAAWSVWRVCVGVWVLTRRCMLCVLCAFFYF